MNGVLKIINPNWGQVLQSHTSPVQLIQRVNVMADSIGFAEEIHLTNVSRI